MGLFTAARLEALVASGCAACAARTLSFRAYVDASVLMMCAEPVGKLAWVYDGERFVDGVFEITCASCSAVAFSASECPRCNAASGLAKALETENTFLPPEACPRCEGQEVRLVAFVPVTVAYRERRADKPRTFTEPLDPGFHAFRVDCKRCGVIAERIDPCPLCAGPGPLRRRPA